MLSVFSVVSLLTTNARKNMNPKQKQHPHIGLKVWSTNLQYKDEILRLYREDVFQYVELFVVPGSSDTIPVWKRTLLPIILHAPHSYKGFNPSLPENEEGNIRLLYEVTEFANELKASSVIFHPGINGTIEETIRQYRSFSSRFPTVFKNAMIENMPKTGLEDETCVGYAPQQVARIARETDMEICLDFGHAVAAATAMNVDYKTLISEFLALEPALFHLSDGHAESVYDEHLHLGQGNLDLGWMLRQLPIDFGVSIETVKDSPDNLDDFVADARFCRRLVS